MTVSIRATQDYRNDPGESLVGVQERWGFEGSTISHGPHGLKPRSKSQIYILYPLRKRLLRG